MYEKMSTQEHNNGLTLEQAEAKLRLVAGKFDSVINIYSRRIRWLQRDIEPDDVDALIRARGMLERLIEQPSVQRQIQDAHGTLRNDSAAYDRFLDALFKDGMTADTRVYEKVFASTIHVKAASLHRMISEYLSQFKNVTKKLQVTDVVMTKPHFNLDERLDPYFCNAGIRIKDNDGMEHGLEYYKIKGKGVPHDISVSWDIYPGSFGAAISEAVPSLVRERMAGKLGTPQMTNPMVREKVLDKFPTPREIVDITNALQRKGLKANIETMGFFSVPRNVYEAVGLPPEKASYRI